MSIWTDSAKWWQQDNRRFESTDPNLLDRVERSLNPMTALGSAMGEMQSGSETGDEAQMVMALLQALPMLGVLKAMTVPGKGLQKAGVKMVADPKTTFGLGVGTAVGTSVYDAWSNRKGDITNAMKAWTETPDNQRKGYRK